MGLSRLLLAAVLVAVAVPASAQTSVRSAHLYADLRPDDGGAEVRIEYVLDVQGAPEMRFELLGFGSASAESFWLGGQRTGTRMQLDAETGSMRAAAFTLTLADTGEPYHLVAEYWIANAVERDGEDVRVRVPVLSLGFPPADGVSDVFRAALEFPPEWSISEGFPTGLEANEQGVYTVALPVVPSMVSARGRTDGTRRPGLPLVIDLLTAAILLAFSFMGWRHLKRAAS